MSRNIESNQMAWSEKVVDAPGVEQAIRGPDSGLGRKGKQMAHGERVSRKKLLQQVLDKLCRHPDIKAAFLASGEGLHIASAAPDLSLDQDELSGLVTRLRKMAQHFQRKMRWAPVDEISIAFGWQHRLVARSVQIGVQELILIVLVNPQGDYQRMIGRAMQVLQQAWQSYRVRYTRD